MGDLVRASLGRRRFEVRSEKPPFPVFAFDTQVGPSHAYREACGLPGSKLHRVMPCFEGTALTVARLDVPSAICGLERNIKHQHGRGLGDGGGPTMTG